jgi:DNA-binding NarL/FixJ family response regulator
MNASSSDPIRVLIVDDHQVVRLGVRALLSSTHDIQVVGEAATAKAAVEETRRLSPTLVLLDIRLPDASGFVACRQIQELPGDVRVLVFTAFADTNMLTEAIQSGADGYLLKEANADGLLDAIRRVAAGQSILDPAVTRMVFGRVRNEATPSDRRRLESLSAQEQRVLALVAEGKTNKEIATAMGLSDKTVKNYLSNLLQKLNMNRRSQAAAFYVQNKAR